MDHFDFGRNAVAAIVIDIGRTKLPDGSWLVDKIKEQLMKRTMDCNRSCMLFMSQVADIIPKSIGESIYQVDNFRQNTNQYPIIDDMKKAAKILSKSSEDVDKHFVLITKNYNEQYNRVFKWIVDQDFEFKIHVIGIGKETELLKLMIEEHHGSFEKILKVDALEQVLMKIGG